MIIDMRKIKTGLKGFIFTITFAEREGRERVTKAAMTMKKRKGSIMEVDEGSRVCDVRVRCCESMAVENSVTRFLIL
ncbi:hypothetical protein TSUD_59170 [Trifolium subterraneum]|uniref:Uncharacterized protein n=1 Tax=Trifolium subterraneum TaxID=3900 RepID=A0A2Z6NGW7_TRISU|nr:hypothetical protein TSUD_59170 [Trifolium subterraneum]